MIQLAELLFSMSLSGTSAFLIYLIAVHFLDSCLSAKVRYFCLKICMALFLFPFPLLKHLILLSVTPFKPVFGTGTVTVYPQEAIIHTDNGFRFPFLNSHVQIFLIIWCTLFITFLCYSLWRLRQFYCHFPKNSTKNPAYLDLLSSLKTDMGISSKIRLYECDIAVSPFTYGFLFPVIFLTGLVNDDSARLTLKHELQHIKAHDFLYRSFAGILLFVHCFNPFSYLFFRELVEVQEMNCDEHLIAQLSADEKKKYGYMLVDFSSQLQNTHTKIICFSKNDYKLLKKRIQKISVKRKSKKLISLFFSFIVFLTGCIPVAAYTPYTLEQTIITKDDLGCDWIEYNFSPEIEPEFPDDEYAFRNSDTYIITENGDIISIFDTVSQYSNCKHTYTSVTQKKHSRTATGCIVKTYRVSYCTKCGFINTRTQTLLSSHTYTPCPH